MPTRYGTSWWSHRVPKSRVPSYPRQRGQLEVEVAVVGGGLTGAMTAYAFAVAGVNVAVLEARRVGGSSAGMPGLMQAEPQSDFRDLVGRYGLRAARKMSQMMRRATLDAAATFRRLHLRTDFSEAEAYHIATGAEAARVLRREFDARRDAGLDVAWLRPAALKRALKLDAAAGLHVRGDGRFDPYRAVIGLAAAASRRGATFFEATTVERVRAGRRGVELRTSGGTVSAQTVVIATGHPTADFKALRRHFHRKTSYCVVTAPLPAPVRRAVMDPDAVLRDSASPAHYLRWVDDDRLLVAGGDQAQVPARARDKALVQRTGQLMYELSLLYPAVSGAPAESGWDVDLADSVDGLPYIGLHRNYPRHLFALGIGHNGAGAALLASRILLRQHLGDPAKGDDLFSFARLSDH